MICSLPFYSSQNAMNNTIEVKGNGNLSQSDFEKNIRWGLFGSAESRSGPGSTMDQTAHIRNALRELFRELGIKVLLDVPYGDFHWMSHVDISSLRYIGGDIVTEMVRRNRVDYGSNDIEFHVINIITDDLPKADVILCRDCLVHLKLEDGLKCYPEFQT